MKCPSCGSAETRTTDTRAIGMIVRRCRCCEACQAEWATTERIDEGSLQVATRSSPSLPVATGSDPRSGSSPDPVRSGPSQQTKKKTERNDPPGFAEFWAAYPRKDAKAAAKRAWLRTKPPLGKCLATLAWQKRSVDWTKDGGQFVPLPASWINAGRWEDEPRRPTSAPGPRNVYEPEPFTPSEPWGDTK